MPRSILAFGIPAVAVGWVWLATGEPVEGDVWFHLAVARDYRDRPLDYRLLLGEGVLAEHVADREPLFHLILAGLLGITKSPVAAAGTLSALAAGALGLVLFVHSRSLLVALAGVFATNTFLFRLVMCRPQGLAVVLVALGLSLLIRKRFRAAAVVNVAYSLTYSVPVLILAASIFQGLASRSARGSLWIAGSSAAGLLIHPHFPQNVVILYYQGFHVVTNALLGNPAGVAIPEELKAWPLADFARDSWLPLVLLALSFRWRGGPRWLSVFQLALLALTLRSMRFVEYWAPTVALGAGDAIRRLIPDENAGIRWVAVLLFLVARPGLGLVAVAEKAREVTAANVRWRGAGTWLRDHGSGAAAFNVEWSAYPELRFFGGSFLIFQGHDPVFLAKSRPDLARAAERVARGDAGAVEFRHLFPAYRFVVALRGCPIERWERPPDVAVVFRDTRVIVMELR